MFIFLTIIIINLLWTRIIDCNRTFIKYLYPHIIYLHTCWWFIYFHVFASRPCIAALQTFNLYFLKLKRIKLAFAFLFSAKTRQRRSHSIKAEPDLTGFTVSDFESVTIDLCWKIHEYLIQFPTRRRPSNSVDRCFFSCPYTIGISCFRSISTDMMHN